MSHIHQNNFSNQFWETFWEVLFIIVFLYIILVDLISLKNIYVYKLPYRDKDIKIPDKVEVEVLTPECVSYTNNN